MSQSTHKICCKLLKTHPPFRTLLWGKSREGVFARILNLFHAYAPSFHSSQPLVHARLTVMRTATAFWKNSSFTELVLWKISNTCVETKPRGIEATCIVSGDRGRSHISMHCGRVHKQNQWQSKNQKLSQVWEWQSTYVRTWGLKKEGEGVCSKGMYFGSLW